MGSHGASGQKPCCECGLEVKTWNCVQCANDAFCDDCWNKQRPHRAGAVGIDGRPHEKVDVEVVSRLTQIFGHNRTPEEQEGLHISDISTTWFGVMKGAGRPFLHCSNRLVDIMCESQTGQHPERFPHIVSFVGQTGAGKSTVIKMLINREQARTRNHSHTPESFPAPVTGLVNDMIPTTGDVHLYSDPGTFAEKRPILYADCEGMSGGEKLPMGVACKEKLEAGRANTRIGRSKLRKPLEWANGAKAQSREFSVKRLYPRILYTFSDVVVFVLREVRMFQTEVLQKLITWAYSSIDKSINQPNLPHIIIVLNATETTIDERQWDIEVATNKLLDDYKDSIYQVQKLQDIVVGLKATGKTISSTRELLEYYYSSISVVRIPTKGRYMQIDQQIGKLYDVIQHKCGVSFAHKKSVRMLLNAERLQQYVNSAYDHFSRRLDEPFDFVKEALRHNQMPKDFRGHILNLMLSLYHEEDHKQGGRCAAKLLEKLSRPIASCVMLAAAREDLQGTYTTLLWNTFEEPLKAAFDEFCDNWLRCAFERDGEFCCNVKNTHKKGHQASSGKVFFKGAYVPQFDESGTPLTEWMNAIHGHIESLVRRLNEYGADGQEKDLVSHLHRREVEDNYPRLGARFKLLGHATCFCCIRSIPEHILPCGHVLCKPCIQSFGTHVGTGAYEMTYCPFHPNRESWTSRPFRVTFKPKDAGVRVLCLDGGGIRGIIELVLLQSIEMELGGFIPIQNFFDLIVGTSAGGIIALGIGVMHWSVSECLEHFKGLCSEAFTARPLKTLALVSHKSYYKSTPLEAALQKAFGTDTLLFGGASCREKRQIKVAVTATSAIENQPVVITNYNSPKAERNKRGARATSAAPLYFKPFAKPETGTHYTDGGIHHNCPAWVAHHERQVIWDDASSRHPDLVLSLGTGLCGQALTQQASADAEMWNTERLHQKRATFGLAFMWRAVYGIIESQLNCEKAWREYCAATMRMTDEIHTAPEARRRHIRINVQLEGARPGLDQLNEIQALEKQAFYSAKHNPDIRETAHRLVASSFYFEKHDDGDFRQDHHGTHRCCCGTICCRFEKGSGDLKGLGRTLRRLVQGDFAPFFFVQENYGSAHETQQEIPLTSAVLARMCDRGEFDLQTTLCVRSPAGRPGSVARISLCLQEDDYQHGPGAGAGAGSVSERFFSISGFPRELFVQEDPNARHASPEAATRDKGPMTAGAAASRSSSRGRSPPGHLPGEGHAERQPSTRGANRRASSRDHESPGSMLHNIFRNSELIMNLGLRGRRSNGNLSGGMTALPTEAPPLLPRHSYLQSQIGRVRSPSGHAERRRRSHSVSPLRISNPIPFQETVHGTEWHSTQVEAGRGEWLEEDTFVRSSEVQADEIMPHVGDGNFF